MTEQERIGRDTLLKRAAAVAGAVYVAPVLTSSAAAEASACAGQACKPGKKGKKKCKKAGGKGCKCTGGKCTTSGGSQCDADGPCEDCPSGRMCPIDATCLCWHPVNTDPGTCYCAACEPCDCAAQPACASDADCGTGGRGPGRCVNTCCGFPLCFDGSNCTGGGGPAPKRGPGTPAG